MRRARRDDEPVPGGAPLRRGRRKASRIDPSARSSPGATARPGRSRRPASRSLRRRRRARWRRRRTRRRVLHRLVMPAVDRDAPVARARGASSIDRHVSGSTTMSCAIAFCGFAIGMREVARLRARNVLNQRAAGGDVQHLRAAADREQRHVAGDRQPRERQFVVVAHLVELDGRMAVRFAVLAWDRRPAPPVSSTPSQPPSALGSGSVSGVSSRTVGAGRFERRRRSPAWATRRRSTGLDTYDWSRVTVTSR